MTDWLYAVYDSTLFGVRIMQNLAVLVLWEKFFNRHPLKAVVELGTLHGGFSQFLLMQAIQRDIEFWTFDIKRHGELDCPLSRLIGLPERFHQGDIFGEAKERVVRVLAESERPLLLYCDDGDKRREVETFTPCLQAGDFVAVHDYGGKEFREQDIEPVRELVEPIFWEECEQVDALTRIWRRV